LSSYNADAKGANSFHKINTKGLLYICSITITPKNELTCNFYDFLLKILTQYFESYIFHIIDYIVCFITTY